MLTALPPLTLAPSGPVFEVTSADEISYNEFDHLAFALTASEAATFEITGGVDAANFDISGSNLRWLSNGVRNYEAPTDDDTDNVYEVEITATRDSDSELSEPQLITLTVNDVLPSGLTALYRADTFVVHSGDGTDVSVWADISGNGYHLTEHGSGGSNDYVLPKFAAAPTGFNGRPAVRFERPACIQTGDNTPSIAQPYSVIVIGSCIASDVNNRYTYFGTRHVNNNSIYHLTNGANVGQLTVEHPTARSGTTVYAGLTVPQVIIGTIDNTAFFLGANFGANEIVASPGTTALQGIVLGNRGASNAANGSGLNGYIAEVIVIPRVLSAPDIATLKSYVNNRYGTSF